MVSRMKDTHTANRVIRLSDDDWEDLRVAAGDKSRSQVLREFVHWYLRRRGAKLPARPPRAE
jgi:hypothetical protein